MLREVLTERGGASGEGGTRRRVPFPLSFPSFAPAPSSEGTKPTSLALYTQLASPSASIARPRTSLLRVVGTALALATAANLALFVVCLPPQLTMAKKKQATKARAAATPPKPEDSDDDLPPLEPSNPASQATPAPTAQAKGRKKEEEPVQSKSKDDWEDAPVDGSDDDMPALTSESVSGGGKGAAPPVLRPVTFGKGMATSKLFDFEPFEEEGVEGACKHLGLDPKLSDSALQSEATKIMSSEVRPLLLHVASRRAPREPCLTPPRVVPLSPWRFRSARPSAATRTRRLAWAPS